MLLLLLLRVTQRLPNTEHAKTRNLLQYEEQPRLLNRCASIATGFSNTTQIFIRNLSLGTTWVNVNFLI
jgi:hypothetical protein